MNLEPAMSAEMSQDHYDPERKLWKPGRRSFLFMFGAAIAGALAPDVVLKNNAPLLEAAGWETTSLKIGDTFTIGGVYTSWKTYDVFTGKTSKVLPVTGMTGSIITLDRPVIASGKGQFMGRFRA